MAEKVTLKLSTAAAAFVGKDATREIRLQAARGDAAVSDGDMVTLMFFLGHDQDPEIRETALRSLRGLSEQRLLAVVETADTHPKILDMLARLHYAKQAVASKLSSNPKLEDQTRAFLAELGFGETETFCPPAPDQLDEEGPDDEAMHDTDEVEEVAEVDEVAEAGEVDEIDEVDEEGESEVLFSKFHLSMKMEIPEKVKMALIGDKEWRNILLKDTNDMVTLAVLKNPRITEPEILNVINSSSPNEEMLRAIIRNKDWMKNYQIRKALVYNCRTPLQTSLRLLTTLNDRDLVKLLRSKDVSSVLANRARKLYFNKKLE